MRHLIMGLHTTDMENLKGTPLRHNLKDYIKMNSGFHTNKIMITGNQ